MEARLEYPATLEIDYPDRPLDRATSFFRAYMVIPIAVVLALVSGPANGGCDAPHYAIGAGGILFAATALMLVFRRKYPRWWFAWNLELTRFSARVVAYLALLRDEYPSTDEEQAVHLDVPYPDVRRDLNRWLPLVKWFLAIPHYIVLAVLWIAGVVTIVIAWFAILFTGRYPESMFRFVVGLIRWTNRVIAYALLLATDVYPPFKLSA